MYRDTLVSVLKKKKKKKSERKLELDFRRFLRTFRSILIINQCIVTSLIQYSLIRLAIVA